MSRESYAQIFVVILALTAIALGSMGSGCPQDDDESGGDDSSDDDADSCDEDGDGDGFGFCDDCDDAAADISPASEEIADGIDNDCDGEVDEGFSDDDMDDDMDDDADDDADDDSGDDDDACNVNGVCEYLFVECGITSFYGTETECQAELLNSCDADPEAYLMCICECRDADLECLNPPYVESCLSDCYVDNCY